MDRIYSCITFYIDYISLKINYKRKKKIKKPIEEPVEGHLLKNAAVFRSR